MNFDERLQMYIDGEYITKEDADNVNKVVDLFKDEFGIELSEENASMFIAHLCAAYSRLHNGEKIETLPVEILNEVRNTSTFNKSLDIVKRIFEVTNSSLDEEEKNYLLLHINNLLGSYGESDGTL